MPRPAPRSPVLRRWFVTCNGTPEVVRAAYARVSTRAVGEDHLRFATGQLERGEENGRLHLHVYLEFSSGVRHTVVRRLVGAPCDHQGARGTRQQAIDYVTKEDTREEGPFVIGEAPAQGARTDLQEVKRLVDQGSTELELWEECFDTMARNHRAIQRYAFLKQLRSADTRPPPRVVVYWGDPGLGKSRRCRYEAAANGRSLFAPDLPGRGEGRWFDGYEPSDDIVLEDYNGEYPLSFFKRILDRYPMQLPVKGSFTCLPNRELTIYITSNHSPDDWYPEATAVDRAALRRRFTSVCHHLAPWTPPVCVPPPASP